MPSVQAKDKASTGQIRKIWGTARNLALDEEQLRDIVEEITGQRRISVLNRFQAACVIDRLCGFAPLPGRLSPQQKWKIKKLTKELGWNDNPARLKGFLRRVVGVDDIDWITPDKAWRVIEALKKMVERYKDGGHK